MDEQSIFLAALEKRTSVERSAFLDGACKSDPELRKRIETLLRQHDPDDSFLEQPALRVDQTMEVIRDAMEAGLSQAFGANAAVIICDSGHSVLKSLGKKLPHVPRVVLRDVDEYGSVEKPDSREVPRRSTDDRYQLHGEIARGGMGAIIKGRDADLGRDLAIKVLLDAHKDKPEVVERFVEEAQIGGQLQHPGIVPVYELGQFSDERPFFSMKLVKGKTLASLLAERDELRQDQTHFLGIFEQICQTMAYAHSRGVIHRDLKPANIMVGAFGEVQVMDWGLAKVLAEGGTADEQKSLDKHHKESVIRTQRSTGSDAPGAVGSHTNVGSVMGTPAYMPPEQALGEVDRLDERADVFGLGAILCEILTGKPPYVEKNGADVFRQAMRGKLDDCFARLDACAADTELIALAKRSLAAEVEDRLRHAGIVADQLTQYLNGVQQRLKNAELARAEAQTRADEGQRRRKLYIAIAGLMLVIALGATVAATRFRHLADLEFRARAYAERQLEIATVTGLAIQSESVRDEFPVKSLLLAVEAVETTRRRDGRVLPIAQERLLNAAPTVGGQPFVHERSVNCVLFSNDGRWLFTKCDNGNVYRWDLEAQDPTVAPLVLKGHVKSPGFRGMGVLAISGDDRWLATAGGGDTPALVWDLNSDDPSASPRVLRGHQDLVLVVKIDPKGTWVATGSEDGTARLWDLTAEDPSLSCQVLMRGSSVRFMSTDRKGNMLAVGNVGGVTRLFDLTSTDPVGTARQFEDQGSNCALSPDGHWFATGSWDTKLRLWDIGASDFGSGTPEVREHQGEIDAVLFSPDSRWLASAGWDNTVKLWDTRLRDQTNPPVVLRGHENIVWTMDFSQDGRWLVSGGWDKTARLWDLNADDPAKSAVVLRAHEDTLSDVAISPDGRWVVTGSWDGSARLWDISTEMPTSSPLVLRGHRQRVPAVAVTPDDSRLISGSWDGTTRVWDLTAEEPGSTAVVLTETGRAELGSLALSMDGKWLVTASNDAAVKLWSLADDELDSPTTRLERHRGEVLSAAISADNSWLVTGSEDGTARVWHLTVPDIAASSIVLPGHDDAVFLTAISPEGRWVITGGGDRRAPMIGGGDERVLLWNLESGDPVPLVLEHEGRVKHVAISSDGRWAVTGSGKTVSLFDLSAADPSALPIRIAGSGEVSLVACPHGNRLIVGRASRVELYDFSADDIASPLLMLEGHSKSVSSAAISSDDRWLVTGSQDNTARVWDLTSPDPMSSSIALRGHSAPVCSVSISQDARWVATGSWDNTVRIWDLNVDSLVARARRVAGRDLTDEERRDFMVLDSALR